MKNKIPALFYMLIISGLLVTGLGAYLKYTILAPLNLYQEEKLPAIPFLLWSDDQTQYALHHPAVEEAVEVTEETVEIIEVATEPEPTEAVTEPMVETTEETTEPKIVNESWFDDALFIGDSRTKGLQTYGKLGEASYFSEVGLSVYGIQSLRVYVHGVGKTSLKSLLMKKDFGKIYISIGINEIMGIHDHMIKKYQELIDMIQEVEPDAVIILQGIMTVGREKAAQKDCFHPDYIASLNERIKALAVGENMRYIDVNEWIADEEGYLPDEWSHDGCHPHADGYYEWSQWLLQNAATLGID